VKGDEVRQAGFAHVPPGLPGRRRARDAVEITVHPDHGLTEELILVLTISAPWIREYFDAGGGG